MQIRQKTTGDQIPGNHKEYIDPGKSAGNFFDPKVKQQYRHNRQRPQPIDIAPVVFFRSMGRRPSPGHAKPVKKREKTSNHAKEACLCCALILKKSRLPADRNIEKRFCLKA